MQTIVDYKTKSAKRGRLKIVDNGVPNYELPTDTSIEHIEELYQIYKHSVPNGIKYKKNYFKALDSNEISDYDLIHGANREQAKAELELTVLAAILDGSIHQLFASERQWFWQSQNDNDLIILREWTV
jgi:hypothetical protein